MDVGNGRFYHGKNPAIWYTFAAVSQRPDNDERDKHSPDDIHH